MTAATAAAAEHLDDVVALKCARCDAEIHATLRDVRDERFIVCRCGDRNRLTTDPGDRWRPLPGLDEAIDELNRLIPRAGLEPLH